MFPIDFWSFFLVECWSLKMEIWNFMQSREIRNSFWQFQIGRVLRLQTENRFDCNSIKRWNQQQNFTRATILRTRSSICLSLLKKSASYITKWIFFKFPTVSTEVSLVFTQHFLQQNTFQNPTVSLAQNWFKIRFISPEPISKFDLFTSPSLDWKKDLPNRLFG
jgi:hypothetical protein